MIKAIVSVSENGFQNGVNALSKMVNHFLSKLKLQNFRVVRTRVLRGKVFGTPTPDRPDYIFPGPDRTKAI